MIVVNRRPGVICVGGAMGPAGLVASQYILVPGSNQVDAGFKQHLKHPDIMEKIEDGELLIIGADEEDEQKEFDIASMKPKDAIELVKETFSSKTLRAWEKTAKGKVLKAIKDQIEEMSKSDEPKEEEDGE